MDLRLLGPLEVRGDDGTEIPLGAPKLRAVLQVLALDPGRVVPTDRLIEDVWDHDPPARALVSLRSYVSNLRRDLARADGTEVVVTRGQGYLLDVRPEELDTVCFERLVADGRAATEDDLGRAVALLDEALALWRGPALADIAGLVVAAAPAARLEQLRMAAREERLAALLELGHHDQVIADAEALVRAEPLRERPHRLLVLALHRVGRTADALEVHRGFRERLTEELGLDPSPAFGALAGQLLRHDPILDAPTSTAAQPPPTGGTVGHEAPERTSATPRWAEVLAHDLVGRRAERDRLAAAVDHLADGTGGLVTVAGEAGIGKSSLLAEAALRAADQGAIVALGRCSETPGAPPFWPWTQVLEDVASAVDPGRWSGAVGPHAAALALLVPELVPDGLERPTPEPSDPQGARFALHRAVSDVLTTLAGDRGLLVIIDDLHWADLASAELTGHLATLASDAELLLVTSHRDTAADTTPELELALAALRRQPESLHLRVAGLDPVEVEQLLDTLGLGVDEVGRATALWDRTGGNPFHLRQLAAVVRDGGDVGTVPPGVRDVLSRRLHRLAPDVVATLEAVAVLGTTADARLVSAVAERPVIEVLDALASAADHGLVRPFAPRDPVHFAHALVRETVLAELPLGRLVRLHAAAGTALAGLAEPPVQEVAEHFWQAADVVGTEAAVAALRAAADAAYRVYATERCETLLQHALDLLAHGGPDTAAAELAVRVDLLNVIKGVHGWTAERLLDHLDQVRTLAARLGSTADLLPMWWSLWALYMTRGDLDQAIELARELLGTADPSLPHTVVAGHVAVGYTSLFRGVAPPVVLEHVEAAEAAEAEADPGGLASVPEHLSLSLAVVRALAHALQGDAAASMAAAERGVALAEQRGEAFRIGYSRLFAAWCAAMLDLPAVAAHHADAGVAVCEEAGLPAIVALIEPNRTWAHVRLGEEPGPWIDRARETDAALAAVGQRHAVSHGRLLLAEAEAVAGDPAADATLAAARAIGEEIGELVYTRQFTRVEARLAQRTTDGEAVTRPTT